MPFTSAELFAGAGGLALGASLAGVVPAILVEWNPHACATIRENRRHPLACDWPLYEGDVRDYDFSKLAEPDLVTGGPPCQPFSLGGKHKGYDDKRDMFPAAIAVVERLRPKAFLFENVKGLARESFADYLRYVLLRLAFPQLTKKEGESWARHLSRLDKEKAAGKEPAYDVFFATLNAADYGVPQKRERLIITGFRRDLGVDWSFPKPTHSLDGLLYAQWVSGEYWEKHRIRREKRPPPEAKYKARVEKLRNACPDFMKKPWITVRDALTGLPPPYERATSDKSAPEQFPNHEYQPGARFYAGHTGSSLDMPAKTIKAGAHGVPGGENMLVDDSGQPRYFTVRESARLQGFPDDYVFKGSWTESMRQLGNAVPVRLARVLVAAITEKLKATGRSAAAESKEDYVVSHEAI